MKNYFKEIYYEHFYYKYKEKLSKRNTILLILLNILIITIIVKGINNQISKLFSPNEIYPKICLDILNNKHDSLSNDLYNRNLNFLVYENIDNKCIYILSDFEKFILENKILDLKSEYVKLTNEKNILSREIIELEKKFINISSSNIYTENAGKNVITENKNLNQIKQQYNESISKLNTIINRINSLNKPLIESKSFKHLSETISKVKNELKEDYRGSLIIYKMKKILISLVFLGPLFFIFLYFLNKYKLQRKYIQFLIFKSLLLTIIIPILIVLIVYVIYFFFSILPFDMIYQIFNENKSNTIVDYYLSIVSLILIFIFVLVGIQKRYNKAIKNYQKINPENYYGDIFKSKK